MKIFFIVVIFSLFITQIIFPLVWRYTYIYFWAFKPKKYQQFLNDVKETKAYLKRRAAFFKEIEELPDTLEQLQ